MSVCIERITQMSSAQAPTCGKSSLTSRPLLPYRVNSNGDFIRVPVLRSVATVPPGSGWPWYLASIGLGSKLSTCDSPPFMNRKMTCLARAGWCSPPDAATAFGFCASSAADSERETRPANAIMPKPLPIRQRASRRVTGGRRDRCDISVHEQKLVRAQQYLDVAAEGRDRQHLLLLVVRGFHTWGDACHHPVSLRLRDFG